MRIRLRFSNGKTSVFSHPEPTVKDLLEEVRTHAGSEIFEIKLGYPPFVPIPLAAVPPDFKLDELELPSSADGSKVQLNGSQLIIETPNTEAAAPLRPVTESKPQPQFNPPPDKDDPPTVKVGDRGELIHVVMPDDNSCLFNAINYVCMGGAYSAEELRHLIAARIQSNKEFYSEAVLEQKPDDYCEWINMPTSWGGGIELGIFAEHFGVEIVALDVQSEAALKFNEGDNVKERVILIYSGIHYDAVSLREGLGYRTDNDIRRFDKNDDQILQGAKKLVAELRKKGYFTDTSNFTLQCNDCGTALKGQKAAAKHGMETGHSNFQEYKGY
ncbi:OTU-domain-containing protein [Ascobolus immersus RN42]|uniref:Ubiquitin thioesterase OTU n=1 Tax=Ascobolus immersus RN42 TaxID=1160509 RepID=A0A3N4I3R0_ASCIM|nr:OTU-domain-containing protein [Ascobolus immersus RN42]